MNEAWSEKELEASIVAYLGMLDTERRGEPLVKSHVYKVLAERFGRTPKAFEYRMQNISYVFYTQVRRWVSGLLPAKNIGANVASTLERILAEVEGRQARPDTEFHARVEAQRSKAKSGKKPTGEKQPSSIVTSVSQFNRDPAVKAWVLEAAGGTCESCGEEAPFVDMSGNPFLEVHHALRLADGGSDTPENAVAVCPNCHRELHFGRQRQEKLDALYARVSRLIRE